MDLRRFWFEFSDDTGKPLPIGVGLGCGVSAYDYDDAIQIIQSAVFEGKPLPVISTSIADVDVSELDVNHVRSNMGNVLQRGVWFPLGYE